MTNEVLLDDFIKSGAISLGRGNVISSIDINDNPGNYPIYSSSALKNGCFGYFNEYNFDEELITWSIDGGGYFFYRPKHRFSVTNVSGILRINDTEKLDYKFLYYLLVYQHQNQVYDYVDKAHPSVIRKRYSIPEISKIEQIKISKILSKIDDIIGLNEKLLLKYKSIKKGLLQDLMSNGIDEDNNIRSTKDHKYKNSQLGLIPAEWECESLESNKILITSGSRGWAKYYNTNGSKFIRITNLKRNQIEIDFSDLKYVDLPVNVEGSRSKLEFGDILISITADLGIIGTVGENVGDAYINQHIALVRLDSTKIDHRFLGYFFASPIGQQIFGIYNDGGAKSGLNLTTINNLMFIKPTLEEQKKIVEKLDLIDRNIDKYKSSKDKYKNIKTGLMQDLLTGKIRVTDLEIEETDAT